ncbi:MAG: hypothetical protein U0K60_03160 [Parafannyhessea umbonata]|nr:hypothetical protein [Parafannyhessea umbonata]
MTRTADISQWRDRTEEPVIVWTYTGVWELLPVAVDAVGPEADEYDQITRAWYAAGYYQTREDVEAEHADDLTPAQIEELYQRGDYSAEAAGLPAEFVATGVNDDGSDAIIYVDEATTFETRRETLEEAARYLDPEDLEEIRAEIEKARADC